MKKSDGFTLIEVMLAVAILATLTAFTAKSIQDALRNSGKYRRQIEETSELRSVLRVIENDINLAFHHRNVQQEVLDEIEKDNNKSQQSNNQNSNFSSNNNDQEKPPNYTRFLGTSDAIHFSSLSNVRTIVDSKESDQAEIGYFLRTCRKRGNPKVSFNCLWRRTSKVIDEDIDKGGNAIPILENLKAIQFRYIGDLEEGALSSEPQWQDEWDSKSNDENGATRFPNAVEITISVNRTIGKKTVTQTLKTVSALRFPNNQKPKTESGNTNELGGQNN